MAYLASPNAESSDAIAAWYRGQQRNTLRLLIINLDCYLFFVK